jgi:hypothetical protein
LKLLDFRNNELFFLEAIYTFEKHIDFIPCRLEASYKPDGWLRIVISDRLYIDFSSPNDFDDSFKKLVDEIKYIEIQSKIYSSKFNFLIFNTVI